MSVRGKMYHLVIELEIGYDGPMLESIAQLIKEELVNNRLVCVDVMQ